MDGRALAVLILVAMMALSGLSGTATETGGDLVSHFEDFSVEDAEPWTDGFDDTSRVYIPPGGLIGTRVMDGKASLKAGASEGWIASEVITCPVGVKYDIVVVDAHLPGDSMIKISVLDATAEATEVGYANATIDGYKDIEGTAVSIKPIDATAYPRLRIQVTLVASGTDRPKVDGWSLYYCPFDEWREDFVTDIRMDSVRGLNLTDGSLELDLTEHHGGASTRSGSRSSDPFPTIVFDRYATGGSDVLNAFYANFDKTGYNAKTDISAKGPRDLRIADLNGDGINDIVSSNSWFQSGNPDSLIYWGKTDGTWGLDDSTDLEVVRGSEAALGDFNGDGQIDIAIAAWHQSLTTSSAVFLNQGGYFNEQPDISFTDMEFYRAGAGDLNNDGYDDIIFSAMGNTKAFFGGPDGPDTNHDITFTVSAYPYGIIGDDFNDDGYDDIIILYNAGDNKVRVHMGSSSGMDNVADHMVAVGGGPFFSGTTGDLNNDGYPELVVMSTDNPSRNIYIVPGTATGWDDDNTVDFSTAGSYVYAMQCADVNGDGIEDLVAGVGSEMRIYYGADGTIDTIPDITKTGIYQPGSIVIDQGGRTSTRKFSGRMVTQPINLPSGKQWDTLVIEGSTPANTSITVTLKDASDKVISGFEDVVAKDLDLSGLTHMSVKVEMWLESDLNTTTPVIDRLRLRWQDIGTWREQFFGPAKAARMMGANIVDGHLTAGPGKAGADLLFTTLRDVDGFNVPSTAHTSVGPMEIGVTGASAVTVGDIDGNGYTDILFATHQTSDTNYEASSPLFMGSAVGWRSSPDHVFPTVGASDVAMEDINGDGYADVVFAQEFDGTAHDVNSTLFWGSADGWSDTTDHEFETNGASGVAVTDADGDGDLDLVFACYKGTSTATDSMVFYQDEGAFPSTPDELLPTKGARAVAAGDVDDDGNVDLVFANSFSGGFAEIDSYIYKGKASGGFETTPVKVPTVGAEDVALADLDGDGDLDLVFANGVDNSQNRSVDSYVYLNGWGTFPSTPDWTLPTKGASGVAVADMDGTGRPDLVFSCLEYNGDYQTPSLVYLGGDTGWSPTPDMEVPTTGASDVLAAPLVRPDTAGYLSKAIVPNDPHDTGAFDTFKFTASLTGSRKGTISILDAETWEVLATRVLEDGNHIWSVRDEFEFRDHTSVRVLVTLTDLDRTGDVQLDNLWLNWSKRVRLPPVAEAISVDDESIYRTTETTIRVTVRDEYTPMEQLSVTIEHHLVGSEGWDDNLLSRPKLVDGVWTATFKALAKTQLGTYEFRLNVTDEDGQWSGHLVGDQTLEVLNRLPSTPTVQITPARPVTTSALRVEVTQGANDPENFPLTYHYRWYRDGVLVPELTGDVVGPSNTLRGENWTVEVCAYDGEDEGPAATVSRIIQNAAPLAVNPLPDPFLDEDGEDSEWLDLSQAFEDPDGDVITWSVDPVPVHITVTIDPTTGIVTLVPEADWNGDEDITFVCSDGELQASQTVTVTVHPLNDAPEIVALNDEPVTGDIVEFTIGQGNTLTITPTVVDVEGHELVFDVNTTAVEMDGVTGVITFSPDNDAVGTLRFALSVHDIVSPTVKVKLNLVFHVVNENDPMDDPRVTNPEDGAQYKANKTFYVTCVCYDPDTPFGQVLNYTWTSSIEGHLGYGNTVTLTLTEVGEHVITVTVTDGEFQKTDSVTIQILPADDGGGGGGPGPGEDPDDNPQAASGGIPTGLMAAVLVALIAAGAGGYMVMSRRKGDEEDEEAPEPEMDEREALQAIADMVGEAADALEESKNGDDGNGNGHTDGEDMWVETEDMSGIEVSNTGVAETQLSMEASVTQAAPAEVEALFADIDTNGYTNGNGQAAEDAEQLRLDNLKRKYANTIGQLPYGIPSAALKDRDWNELASALATGEKKTVEGDREVTNIDGDWYYSDMGDPSSFLKEHGAKPKVEAKAGAANGDLLAKLEERFILGEISEETYRELKEKYGS
ncbi:MAG: VCBS repeat-containing protein [Thermoplasmata archaeon]|nr:MAG: VCBS repeat-containing protein [Thermoplasmata archaeon]